MNNKVCKEYIREIKTIFPVKSKQEREYIKNLSNDIADFCEQEGICLLYTSPSPRDCS